MASSIISSAVGAGAGAGAGTNGTSVNTRSHVPVEASSSSSSTTIAVATNATAAGGDEFDSLRKSLQPVTHKELQDALLMLKFDIHKEVQSVILEQNRLFSLAKVCMCCIVCCMHVLYCLL